MKTEKKQSGTGLWRYVATWLVLVCAPGFAAAQDRLDSIDFTALSGDRFEIELGFNGTPPQPEIFVIDDPARLTLDFPNVTNQLSERRYPLTFAGAESVMVLEAQGRTRMVVNLTASTPYETRVQGNSLFIVVGAEGANAAAAPVLGAQAPQPGGNFIAPAMNASDIRGIDFRRGENNSGQVIVELENSRTNATITQNGTRLIVEMANANIDADDQVRLDVTDFGTPVQSVSMYNDGNNVIVQADVTGQYEYLAYQTDGQYVVSVTPVAAAVTGAGISTAADFTGDRITMNFQNIEVRAALQILADFNDFSLVAGDNVTGSMTLRLDNVPWDQALDIVLRARALDKRQIGSVLYVAPATEIASAELQALESTQQVASLAPLVTEYIEVNYAEASDLLPLLQPTGEGASGGLLTERGRASVDNRTNTIIVQDVESVLDDIKALLARLDVPVRQVLIEARIVNASTTFSEALGVRWGGAQTFPEAGEQFILGGSLESTIDVNNNLVDYNQAINEAVIGGQSLGDAIATTALQGPTFPDALVVDLGVPNPPSSIALGYAGNSGLIQLELSALESSGNGEVIAQPKITTQDQQTARISSGVQIPYQSQAGGTAGGTTTQFVPAELSLEVTPQITPDGRIIMQLDIHQDSIQAGAGAVPAIATNTLNTRVLVNNGDTVVLGGVFREEVTTTVSKTPLLGDLPYVGNLFKRTEDSETKTELLIFITPSIINELVQ